MDALVKQLAIRLAESTVVMKHNAGLLEQLNYTETGALVREHIEKNNKLLDEIKTALKE